MNIKMKSTLYSWNLITFCFPPMPEDPDPVDPGPFFPLALFLRLVWSFPGAPLWLYGIDGVELVLISCNEPGRPFCVVAGDGLGDWLLLLCPLTRPGVVCPKFAGGLGAIKIDASAALARLLCCLEPDLLPGCIVVFDGCSESLEGFKLFSWRR